MIIKRDLQFYKRIMVIALPIIIQNIITNFVSLVDNVMIGSLGTLEMSGVSIVNAVLFVYNLTLYGANSGPGIYTSQFVGTKNKKGVQECFYFKLFIGIVVVSIGILMMKILGKNLIGLYLSSSNSALENTTTLNYAYTYLSIMLVGLVPFMLSQVYMTTLRETENTLVPMIASMVAIFSNVVLNALLIFGIGIFPKLGITGAAIATVISRYIEFFILFFYAHFVDKVGYFKNLYTSIHINLPLYKNIIIKGFPLLCNEFLWGFSLKAIVQCYSTRGIEAVAAINITSTVVDMFQIMTYSVGMSISILLAQRLGNNDQHTEIYKDAWYMIYFGIFMCAITGITLSIVAPFFVELYNTTDTVKSIALMCLRISSIDIIILSLDYSSYYILRAGGKTFITFLFDSIYTFFISFGIAFILSRCTSVSVVIIYLAVALMNIPKGLLGMWLVKKKIWMNNIVEEY